MTLSLFPARAAIGIVRGDRVYPTPELLRALQSLLTTVGGVSGMEGAEDVEVMSLQHFSQSDYHHETYQLPGVPTTAVPEVMQPVFLSEMAPEVFQPFGASQLLAAFFANPTSANLAAALTDETGTGAAVFANSPTLTTPKMTSYTVANLPAAATAGATARAYVTDANATTFASVVAGGGANAVPVYSDGTDWRIG